ncbi:hypothetical protein MKX08_002001 [Trichoderma sp. CBMAI-0020]|nr:hypothetical protein MKX08_002001 [Trichoderma sp. CBMAI-0020]
MSIMPIYGYYYFYINARGSSPVSTWLPQSRLTSLRITPAASNKGFWQCHLDNGLSPDGGSGPRKSGQVDQGQRVGAIEDAAHGSRLRFGHGQAREDRGKQTRCPSPSSSLFSSLSTSSWHSASR